MTEEQERLIAQIFANNAGNKITVELANGIFTSIKKILENKDGG